MALLASDFEALGNLLEQPRDDQVGRPRQGRLGIAHRLKYGQPG
jgi:hypothetical protein